MIVSSETVIQTGYVLNLSTEQRLTQVVNVAF